MEVTLYHQHSQSTLQTLANFPPTLTQHTSYTRNLFYQNSQSTLQTLAVCSTNTHTAHFKHSQFVLTTLTQHTSNTRNLFYQNSQSTLQTHAVCSSNTHTAHFKHSPTETNRSGISFSPIQLTYLQVKAIHFVSL
jgi:hypothetical protein